VAFFNTEDSAEEIVIRFPSPNKTKLVVCVYENNLHTFYIRVGIGTIAAAPVGDVVLCKPPGIHNALLSVDQIVFGV
jgi:hypothetical protein